MMHTLHARHLSHPCVPQAINWGEAYMALAVRSTFLRRQISTAVPVGDSSVVCIIVHAVFDLVLLNRFGGVLEEQHQSISEGKQLERDEERGNRDQLSQLMIQFVVQVARANGFLRDFMLDLRLSCSWWVQ